MEEFHAAMEKLPNVGDRVVALLTALVGSPVGILIVVNDPECGGVTTTTNMADDDEVKALIQWLAQQHEEGAYDTEESPARPTLQ